MQLEFDEGKHEYKLNGNIVPSVTQVINDVLPGYEAGDWYKERGRALHLACQLADEGRLKWESVHEEIQGKVKAWQRFRHDWPRKILATEHRLAHLAYQFAGTIDRVFADNESPHYNVIVDLKSTITPQVKIQIGFYSLLWRTLNRKIDCRGGAVELKNDGNYKVLWMRTDEVRRHEQIALNCLGVYNFKKLNNLLRTP